MTDARTIIIEALGPEVPASWRKQVADRMFTALRSAGFEVCAVAAPTTDARTTIHEIVAQISDTAPLSAENIDRAVAMIHEAVAAPTITPQPTRAALYKIAFDAYYGGNQGVSVIRAVDAVLEALDGVGGSITPSDEITITPAMQKLNTLLSGWPVGGSITPADQEGTERKEWRCAPGEHDWQRFPQISDGIVCAKCAADQEDTDGGGSPAAPPGASTDPDRDAWLAKYGDLRGFIDPGVEGAP